MSIDKRVRDLIGQGDGLFSQRAPMLSIWQEIAENFYPTRADFTVTRYFGSEFASGLMTGAPILAHRELSDQFAAMLRPRGKDWFKPTVEDNATAENVVAKAWLEDKAAVMRRVMYDRQAGFTWATKEADRDFAAFGQAVMTVEMNDTADGVLFRCWHIRDVAWAENARREIDTVHRKWKIPARSLVRLFPKMREKPEIKTLLEKEPNKHISCRHIVVPADEYELSTEKGKRLAKRFPLVSIYVDCDHDTVLEETPIKRSPYVIPRWMTVSGSQYAHSPATVVALPDARLLQQITLTMLEAGQKQVDPPMVAAADVIQGGANIYPGGITWIDRDYDQREGTALEVLPGYMKGNLAFGEKVAERYEMLIKRAFYLDQINLPPAGSAMTATEVRSRIEEYIRAALPLFEPLEIDYNGALCEAIFNLCLEHGAFGPREAIPPMLQGQDVKFVFESPLQAAQSRDRAQAFSEAAQLLAAASQIDPHAAEEVDIRTAFRDALGGIVPAKWIRPDDEAQQARNAQAQAAQAEQMAKAVSTGAQVAGQVGDAASRLSEAGLVPQAAQLAPVAPAPV